MHAGRSALARPTRAVSASPAFCDCPRTAVDRLLPDRSPNNPLQPLEPLSGRDAARGLNPGPGAVAGPLLRNTIQGKCDARVVIEKFNKDGGEPHSSLGFVDADIERHVLCRRSKDLHTCDGHGRHPVDDSAPAGDSGRLSLGRRSDSHTVAELRRQMLPVLRFVYQAISTRNLRWRRLSVRGRSRICLPRHTR
jgi:hypothetical protein